VERLVTSEYQYGYAIASIFVAVVEGNNMTNKTLNGVRADEASVELIEYLTGPNEQNNIYRAQIRPEVAKFAIEMETVLRENDNKTGWDKLSVTSLFHHIKDEFDELEEAYLMYIHPATGAKRTRDAIQNMRREAIDMANFCMFLCHNYPEGE